MVVLTIYNKFVDLDTNFINLKQIQHLIQQLSFFLNTTINRCRRPVTHTLLHQQRNVCHLSVKLVRNEATRKRSIRWSGRKHTTASKRARINVAVCGRTSQT